MEDATGSRVINKRAMSARTCRAAMRTASSAADGEQAMMGKKPLRRSGHLLQTQANQGATLTGMGSQTHAALRSNTVNGEVGLHDSKRALFKFSKICTRRAQ